MHHRLDKLDSRQVAAWRAMTPSTGLYPYRAWSWS